MVIECPDIFNIRTYHPFATLNTHPNFCAASFILGPNSANQLINTSPSLPLSPPSLYHLQMHPPDTRWQCRPDQLKKRGVDPSQRGLGKGRDSAGGSGQGDV
jgi:hypothetical protein